MLTGSFLICVLLISSVGMYPGDVAHVYRRVRGVVVKEKDEHWTGLWADSELREATVLKHDQDGDNNSDEI